MSKAITERPDDRPSPAPGEWRPARESAPSVLREDEPRLARGVGILGLFFIGLAVAAMLLRLAGFRSGWIGPGWSAFFVAGGLVALLFHAVCDKEQQIRRVYGAFGLLWLAVGVILSLVALKGSPTLYFGSGFACLWIALLFLLAFARNETEVQARELIVNGLGGVGALLALVGFIGGSIGKDFLLPYGLLLVVLGLAYLWAFVAIRGVSDDIGYRAALGMGVLGGLAFLVALGRTVLPPLFLSWHWISRPGPEPYLVPWGLLLMLLGMLYALVAVAYCSDNRFVVLTRRELAGFFYSPIAHLVLLAFTVVAWYQFLSFIDMLLPTRAQAERPMIEPIVLPYVIDFPPIFTLIFIVPVLTMRLLSEERRTGTFEVLMTAPVDESAVAVSKFVAALVFYLLIWVPWAILLVALRIQGDQPFDYRPLISFFIALVCTGAGFMAMGLFFSSLTRNQIVSAVMTFAGMLLLTMVYFVKGRIERPTLTASTADPWVVVLRHISYLDLWIESLQGVLVPKYLLFHIGAAIFWVFATIKVLEARKWA